MEALDLHIDGCSTLDARPHWCVLEFCEQQHKRWQAVTIEVLLSLQHTWYDGNERPGEVTASYANEILHARGARVWISTTHPSVESEAPYDITGPRWYCSIISAALDKDGCCMDGKAPRPPSELQRLLWPDASEGAQPWITELGWTLVPGGSDAQTLHADIVSRGPVRDLRSSLVHGRYHHVVWKAPSSPTRHVTTEVAARFFTNGARRSGAYESLRAHFAVCLVVDSELLHRGGPTAGPPSAWTSSCTIQLCSTSGWPALHEGGRCTPELAKYVIPIAPASTPPLSTLPTIPAALSSAKRARVHLFFDSAGGPMVIDEPAAPAPAAEAPAARPGSATHNWAAIAAARALTAAREWSEGAPSAADVTASLTVPGWLALSGGLPASWAWEVFSLVDALHERFEAEISSQLAVALLDEEGRTPPCGSATVGTRPGERAASEVTAALHQRGLAISVYAGPPSQAQVPPYGMSGPRFYVSVTQLACDVYGADAPAMPPALRTALWPRMCPDEAVVRVRGLGWALAPPGSDPQLLHADIWAGGTPSMPRFPHVLWKRGFAAHATTELVPSGFTHGATRDTHYEALAPARAPAVIFNSEILHRGGATAPVKAPTPAASGVGWVSSCSVELCSAAGWEEWDGGATGGTEFSDAPEYRMLPIRCA